MADTQESSLMLTVCVLVFGLIPVEGNFDKNVCCSQKKKTTSLKEKERKLFFEYIPRQTLTSWVILPQRLQPDFNRPVCQTMCICLKSLSKPLYQREKWDT